MTPEYKDDPEVLKYVQAFVDHANFVPLNLRGKLLVIGPAMSLIDMMPVLPFLDGLNKIDIVSYEFSRGVLKGKYDLMTQLAGKPDMQSEIYGHTKFEDLTSKYDSAVFFGAPHYTALNQDYLKIPLLLEYGGVAYCTVNVRNFEPVVNFNGATFTAYNDVLPHPTYGDGFTGLVIQKS